MNRRDFMKTGGVVLGGSILPYQFANAFRTNTDKGPIKIGVIGCGDRGKGLMHVMSSMPEQFEIVAFCDNMDFRLDQTSKAFPELKAKSYKNYQDLLDNGSIEAVAIATPLNMHFAPAKAAMEAGKHVYLEKTMTYNIPEAMELVELVKNNPTLTLQVGHQYRYTPLYYKVKDMIQSGYLGKITQIDSRWDRNWNWKRPVSDPSLERIINWRMYREYSGGLPAELLSHQIDFINWAFETHPDTIIGTGGIDNYHDGRETYDNVQLLLRYEKEGMIGNFGATCSNAREGYSFSIKGTEGTVDLLMNEGYFYPEKDKMEELQVVDGVSGATKLSWKDGKGIPILEEKTKDGTWYAFNDFYKSIQSKEYPASNVISGATTATCIHLANHSLFNKTIESWKPAYNYG
ncbi:gfo/Idh/MocA family oxidoreductase [Echinicola strongylocentroti]|uniref:Gfo/Idh/MocA family oxidoreductase n=1 Tax=Echinicola strongylocentroti TaxID=1795355 RepID=A0A2Z4IKS0_9BACT|nr:Gfo/Idh/MocA family oxidoreductase [Echinicola strongylocentroti]AWW31701.1 gfo/Idh/MocA family oxidoreductase [Echinicola strongylocentroti]